jgi:hypothetical protein
MKVFLFSLLLLSTSTVLAGKTLVYDCHTTGEFKFRTYSLAGDLEGALPYKASSAYFNVKKGYISYRHLNFKFTESMTCSEVILL